MTGARARDIKLPGVPKYHEKDRAIETLIPDRKADLDELALDVPGKEPKQKKSGRPPLWNDEQKRICIEMADAGRSNREIAEALGKPYQSVRTERIRLLKKRKEGKLEWQQ